MRNKIISGLVLLVVIVGLAYFANKKEVVAPDTSVVPVTPVPVVKNSKPIELCFAKFGQPNTNGYYDKYTLRLMLDGDKATGELNLLPAEKDRKTGDFKGTVGPVNGEMMARTANLWWYTVAEGMNTEEELKIIFGEGTASLGFGEMMDRGDGVYVYKDPKKVSFNLFLTDVACTDLDERVNVEGYLKENISKLSPVKAPVGGTWFVTYITIDINKNSGVVTYEDGHREEKRNFTYVTEDKGEVKSLTIN